MMKSQSIVLGSLLISSFAVANPVDLVLRMKEKMSLENLASSVMNPASPRYNHFYTTAELRELVAPNDQAYQFLVQDMKSRGFTIVRESESHLSLQIRGEQSQVESLLNTKFKPYTAEHPGVSAEIRLGGVTAPATVPAKLNDLIASVSGLDESVKRRPHYTLVPENGPRPRTGTATTISQANIKKSYGFNPIYANGITGAGQNIAIATYGNFHMDDVKQFYVQSHITPAPAVDQVTFNGDAPMDEDSALETQLDSEFTGMIAPGANIHVFTSAENSEAGELAMFTAILDDGRAKIVNYSWGVCEAQLNPSHRADMDKVFARAIAQGVNILVATGDTGSDGCEKSTKKSAGWPASMPYAVAVGGTTYGVDANGQLAETAWSGNGAQQGGSGGGISKLYPLPDFQNNFQSPYIKRSIPDVAFNANPASGENIWTSCSPNPQTGACQHGASGHWMNVGGTSMATPQWAGFLALVNESRAKAHKDSIGFINPIIYSLSSSDRAKLFHDVTSGNNGYAAGAGWDAVTGWGSMQADALLSYLTAN